MTATHCGKTIFDPIRLFGRGVGKVLAGCVENLLVARDDEVDGSDGDG